MYDFSGHVVFVFLDFVGTDSLIEQAAVLSEVDMLLKNPKRHTVEEQMWKREGIEKRTVKYHIPVTDEVKDEIKRMCKELGTVLARYDIHQAKEYAKRG